MHVGIDRYVTFSHDDDAEAEDEDPNPGVKMERQA